MLYKDKHTSPQLHMPKPKQQIDALETHNIDNTLTTKCLHCFFLGRDFKFDININLCHLAPLEKYVRAKEDAFIDWTIAQIVSEQFKDGR